ncbi:hypothetical protein M3175_01410 [Robertmurraya korlensis]|uniref:hypothetical protein n=1 Tax=Robertmurraya korlensis TaxID=519977 RepID=UPI0020408255|nr:hypothetical protein [Robertmurraya korlensis]MCM3599372.1 hypothetical protein [Robertmurraya korlensis]
MSKNPIIQKAKKEAYDMGYKNGLLTGKTLGQDAAINFIADRFDGLDKIPGIGPKLYKKIVHHFGIEYFKKVEVVKGGKQGKAKKTSGKVSETQTEGK